jgi:hypothetical protein
MALISRDELNSYAGDFNADLNDTKDIIIDAAEAEVEKYLGYSPVSGTRVYRFTGYGNAEQVLDIPNASAITAVTIDGTTVSAAAYTLDADLNAVRLTNLTFTRDKVCTVSYTAGWATIPGEIKLACLRIASLMLTETNGNIGVTGKSFADMSRQFVNTTNFNKYLLPLSHLRRGTL